MTVNSSSNNQNTGAALMPKKKRPLKWWIIGAAVLVLAAVIVIVSVASRTASTFSAVRWNDSTVLALTDVEKKVSATGKIESADSRYVYSTQGYLVKSVDVSVGDYVMADDVLCVLDAKALEESLAKSEASLSKSQGSADLQLESSQSQYDYASNLLSEGLNSQLLSAKNGVNSARINRDEAYRRFDEAVEGINNDTNSSIISARNAVTNAEKNLSEAIIAHENAQSNYNRGLNSQLISAQSSVTTANTNYDTLIRQRADVVAALNAMYEQLNAQSVGGSDDGTSTPGSGDSIEDLLGELANIIGGLTGGSLEEQIAQMDSQLKTIDNSITQAQQAASTASQSYAATQTSVVQSIDQLSRNVESAISALDYANKNLQATYASVEGGLEQYASSIATADQAYYNARKSLQAVELAVEKELESLGISLESSKLNSDLTTYEMDLDTLNRQLDEATLRSPIEGTVTQVSAKVGMPGSGQLFMVEDTNNLIIKTTIKEYDIGDVKPGMTVIIKTDATGETEFEGVVKSVAPTAAKNSMGNDVEFETEIEILSKDESLRIGLNTRLNIIVDSAANVFAVPYTAIFTDASGASFVRVASPASTEGRFIVSSVQVEIGVESDWNVQVSSSDLTDGMRILNEYTAAENGQTIQFSDASGAQQQAGGLMFSMGGR